MENIYILLIVGFLIGTLGTLIGAGGGFILVPLLIIFHPDLTPENITAISMAVVACNALSGSAAYINAKRVDYKAGLIFAAFTIPGSILGVMTTKIIPRYAFDMMFGIILITLAIFLFLRGGKRLATTPSVIKRGFIKQRLTDKWNETYVYAYDVRKGSLLSIIVGYISPLLGIGGGIIHVPAMAEWLRFPVHIATATSHFILAIMATITVLVHVYNGSYNDPIIIKMIIGLSLGVIPGAQLGAFLSRRLHGRIIIRALAVSLVLVGIRILVI